MKKMTFMAIAMGLFAFTACQQTKKEAPAAEPVVEVITDSATQQKVAGEYKSADGKRIITINSDFTAKTTGLDKDFSSGSSWLSQRILQSISILSVKVWMQR